MMEENPMSFYQVFLRDGITGGVEVSDEGRIISATYPVLYKAIGLRFARFNAWVKGRGGEIHQVKGRVEESRSS
jgi:hypothetical protein